MKVWVQGKKVQLSQKSFVGKGGQASVYACSGTAYKIYTDPAHMIAEGKIAELAAIADSRIIAPKELIRDAKRGDAIGYTMDFVEDAFVLCQLFSRAFRQRHGITHEHMHHLVEEMRKGIEAVHRAGVLLVDGNELNFLVSKDFQKIYFVDVDSYQTPGYPAAAIMESIRDRHQSAGVFSQGSDWFSFAVVALQLFMGIHPYKGKHPRCKGLDARMQANLSVFDSEVRIPKTAFSASVIPGGYRAWLEGVVAGGSRTAPRKEVAHKQGACREIVLTPLLRGTKLRYRLLQELNSEILTVFAKGPNLILVTADGIWNGQHRMCDTPMGFVGIALGPDNEPLSVAMKGQSIEVRDLQRTRFASLALGTAALMVYDGRIYVHHKAKVSEVRVMAAQKQYCLSLQLAVNVLPKATSLWPGFVLQNLLGTTYVSLLHRAGHSYQLALPELSNAVVLDAQLTGTTLVASAHREGEMQRLVFRFDSEFTDYDCRVVKEVEVATANVAQLDTGVCLCLNEDEQLEVFHGRKDSTKLDLIADTSLCGEMKLVSRGAQLLVVSHASVYQLQMA